MPRWAIVLTVTPLALCVGCGAIGYLFPGAIYSALPILADGRIELTRIEDSGNMIPFLISREVFEAAIEGGINDALREHGLTPVSLMLESGVMTIEVIPGACLGRPGGMGACDPATPGAEVGLHNR